MGSWCAKGEKWPGSGATCTRPGRPLSAQHVLYSPCQRACLFDHASLCVRACVAACEQSIFPLIFYHSKSKYCQLPFLLGKKIVPDCQLPVFFYRCVFIDDQLRGPAHVRAGRQLRWSELHFSSQRWAFYWFVSILNTQMGQPASRLLSPSGSGLGWAQFGLILSFLFLYYLFFNFSKIYTSKYFFADLASRRQFNWR